MKSPTCLLLTLLVVMLAGAAPHPAAAQPTAQPTATGGDGVELRPGVVIDPQREAIYLMRPGEGCEAVAMANGEVVWASAEASKPLGLSGERLIVQTETAEDPNQLEVRVLDARTGATGRELEIEVPAGAWTAIDDGPTARLTTFATAAPQGELIVWWEAERREARGMAPLPDLGAPGLGEPAPLPAPGSPPPPLPLSPPPPDDLSAQPEVQRWSGASRLTFDDGQGGRSMPLGLGALSLAPLAPPPLDPALDLPPDRTQLRSADGRHLLVSERIADDREWEKYRWRILNAETGQEIGSITSHFAAAPFYVSGTTLYYESPPTLRLGDGNGDGDGIVKPLQLRAADLLEGRELWSRPIRDTAYRGPFPP